MSEVSSAEKTPEVWRTPKEWSEVLAAASVAASVHVRYKRGPAVNVSTTHVGYKARTIESRANFFSDRRNGKITQGDCRYIRGQGMGSLFSYSRATQVQQLKDTLTWLYAYGVISATDKKKWQEVAEQML